MYNTWSGFVDENMKMQRGGVITMKDGSIYHRSYIRSSPCAGPYLETIDGKYKLAAVLDAGGMTHGTAVEFDEDGSIHLVYFNHGTPTGLHKKGC